MLRIIMLGLLAHAMCSASPAAFLGPQIQILLMEEASAANVAYPVIDTMQDTCYDASGAAFPCPDESDALFGQDAQHTGTEPVYADNLDGTVNDDATGLVWQQSPDLNGDGTIDSLDKLTHSQAQNYCEQLTLGGQVDWRLPTIKELYSLFDANGVDPNPSDHDTTGLTPFIDTLHFDFEYGDVDAGERIIDSQYASDTVYVADDLLFGVNFADGRIKGYWMNNFTGEKTFLVQCVRGNEAYGANTYADISDGTVTDEATGLEWTQADSGYGMDWYEALAYVQEMNAQAHLGHDDWRLPDVKELQSIVDYARSPDTTGSAAIDPVFEATPIINEEGEGDWGFYWSSTTHVRHGGSGDHAMYVAFGRGLGYMNGEWIDVHGAGCQRSDPKQGDPDDYPTGMGPQGDARRIDNFVRLVRDADTVGS
jgi:formylglycine-generating enzyme required for sulfatase activity